MIKRGLKRKATEDGQDAYQQSLQNFQNATRKRESMRIKTSVSDSDHDDAKNLRRKIQIETSLCLGTAKFLRSLNQDRYVLRSGLEAAKTLKLGRLRVDMLKYELNKLRRGRGGSPSSAVLRGRPSYSKPTYAGLSLSHIRIPLIWRKNNLHQKFAIFCIARIGSQIYDTGLLYPVEPGSTTDITFDDDVILFAKVSSYFELTIEVYSHLIGPHHSNSSHNHNHHHQALEMIAPQKIYRSLSKAMGKTILKRGILSSSGKAGEEGEEEKLENLEAVGPKFDLIATSNLSLEHCSDEIQSHELYVESLGLSDSSESLNNVGGNGGQVPPLFGSICCRLAAQPYCCEEEVFSGTLRLLHQLNSSSIKYVWGSLMNWKLSIWNDKSQKEAARIPLIEIPVCRDTALTDENGNIQIRNDDILWEFGFDDTDELNSWFGHLSQHASDHRRWKHVAEKKMQVLSPDASKSNHLTRTFNRTRSKLVLLYNNIGD